MFAKTLIQECLSRQITWKTWIYQKKALTTEGS
jgi:hypothetical protein